MKISQSIAKVLSSPSPSTRAKVLHRAGAASALALFLCFGGASDLKGQQPIPLPCASGCKGSPVPALIGVGAGFAFAAIMTAIDHHRHTLQGCVTNGQNGLELHTSDETTYLLEGNSGDIKAGDRVMLSGAKKKVKHRRSFIVNDVWKDFGPCADKLASNAQP